MLSCFWFFWALRTVRDFCQVAIAAVDSEGVGRKPAAGHCDFSDSRNSKSQFAGLQVVMSADFGFVGGYRVDRWSNHAWCCIKRCASPNAFVPHFFGLCDEAFSQKSLPPALAHLDKDSTNENVGCHISKMTFWRQICDSSLKLPSQLFKHITVAVSGWLGTSDPGCTKALRTLLSGGWLSWELVGRSFF